MEHAPESGFTPITKNTFNFSWASGLFILLFLTVSCTKSVQPLENFDPIAWRGDREGCEHKRVDLLGSLLSQQDKLLGLDEMEIIQVLGKPDQNELYKRNEKYYYYFIDPSSKCTSPNKNPQRLAIRFNAMGLAKELMIQ